MSTMTLDPKCASYHFGIWMIEPEWFRSAVNAVRSGVWPAQQVPASEEPEPRRVGYRVRNRVAIVPIAGPMMKARSKFGGTSTVDVRTAIRQAVSDDSVASILLLIDSPGGTVAGTEALAQDVDDADKRKPVYAHIEDLGASAAYYVAAQARRVTASPTSLVGSLGTMMALDDVSKNYEMNGVKTYLISSGGMKGAGTEGTEISPEQLAYFQGLVDGGTRHFKNAVKRGREMSTEQVDALFDGRVHDAAKALQLGLIDGVKSVDSAMVEILAEIDDGEDAPIEKAKQTAINIIKNNMLAAVPMNPDDLVAGIVPVPQQNASTPEASPRGEAPSVSLLQESAMAATDTPPAPDPAAPSNVSPPAQAKPTDAAEARQREIERLKGMTAEAQHEHGRVKGISEGRAQQVETMKQIIAACPGKPQMAIDAFLAGQSPESVKLAFDESAKVEAAARLREQEKDLEIARWQQLAATGGYPGGIGMTLDGGTLESDAPSIDPKAQAESEWEHKPSVRKGFTKKENYVAFRTRELNGTVRMQTGAN